MDKKFPRVKTDKEIEALLDGDMSEYANPHNWTKVTFEFQPKTKAVNLSISEKLVNEHDCRQYKLIEEHIKEFENGKLKLSQLINAVDGLLGYLKLTEEDWIERFQSEWWTLEQVYAVALDRQETILSSDTQSLVHQTLENMKTLLKEIK